MLVISAGMQKSGSGWYFNMANDLLVATGNLDARETRKRFKLSPIMRHYNCNIGRPYAWKLAPLLLPVRAGISFTVKTHERPTYALKRLARTKLVKSTYTFRDPRDVIISALDHGQELRAQGKTGTFARLQNFSMALDYVEDLERIWRAWSQLQDVLLVRYESLLADTAAEIRRLADFLGLDVSDATVSDIEKRYRPTELSNELRMHLHLNEARVGRWLEHFTPDQLQEANDRLGSWLKDMGYPY